MSPGQLGATVRRRREAQGLSQLALAKRARVSQSYLSQLEAGIRGKRPGFTIIQRLAKALDVPVTALTQ